MNQGSFAPGDDGACKGHPTEWWFPHQKSPRREELVRVRQNTARAKEICASCSVREQCLEYSLYWEPWGIWGGEDEQSRANIRWVRKIRMSVEGRIVFTGVGVRDANGGDFLNKKKVS